MFGLLLTATLLVPDRSFEFELLFSIATLYVRFAEASVGLMMRDQSFLQLWPNSFDWAAPIARITQWNTGLERGQGRHVLCGHRKQQRLKAEYGSDSRWWYNEIRQRTDSRHTVQLCNNHCSIGVLVTRFRVSLARKFTRSLGVESSLFAVVHEHVKYLAAT